MVRAALLLLLLGAGAAAAQEPSPVAAGLRLVDRVVAIVDDDPILLSEVEQVLALEIVARLPGESDRQLQRRVLDQLIEQRVRFHEIDRFGTMELPADEVERQYQAIRARFASEAELAERLAAVGLDERGLRNLVARQVMVLRYVEERLGLRVFVELADIRRYYDEELTPRLEAAGAPVPPFAAVREEIRSVLREERLDAEVARWTEQLRREADVLDYLDAEHEELPPVVAVEP